jgi:ATP-binding protein involved in chromosome partitioning
MHNLASVRHIIAVAAGKGGVGKSTVALNLALFWQKKGAKVGLMDADLYGPSLRKMLPEELLPAQNAQISERIIPAMSRGIKLMSMAYFLEEGNPASVRAPIANGIIKQFIHTVDWGELDFLIIDFPPGTGDIQLTLMQESQLSGGILVTTPQEIALLDVAKATAMFRQMQVPLIGIVENMSYYEISAGQKIYPFGKEGGKKFAEQNGLFFLGQVPIDPQVSHCCDTGTSLFAEEQSTFAGIAFAEIGNRVLEQLSSFHHLSEDHLKKIDLSWEKM